MNAQSLFSGIISQPDKPLPFEALPAFVWWQEMADCPQDPLWHAEGDVATHTRMIVEELVRLPAFQELPERERARSGLDRHGSQVGSA